MSVWMLLVFITAGQAGASWQIETRSLEECERVQKIIWARFSNYMSPHTLCVEVRR